MTYEKNTLQILNKCFTDINDVLRTVTLATTKYKNDMTKKNIITAALAVASLAGVAMAGTTAPVAYKSVQKPSEKRFCGALSAGYSTNYDYRGLVPNTSSGTNNTPVELDLCYKLTDHWALYTDMGYKAIWDKDVDVNNNEFSFELGAHKKSHWVKGLTYSPNYKLTSGGWMGEFIKQGRDSSHSTFHSFGLEMLYDFGAIGAKGFFLSGSADYVFYDATGWWFQVRTGYEAKITERLSAILALEYNGTAGFYGDWAGAMTDGDMSYGVTLDLPYKVCKNLTFKPFVGIWWLGSSANNINHGGQKALRNHTVAAGANLVWNF